MAVVDVISSVTLGMGLPSGDVGTDIYLSVRLFLNGHPRWALCVLMPLFPNIFFTIFACIRIEKRGWFYYLPIVLLQLYPQFCMARLLFQWGKGIINRKKFLQERNNLDGGLGCLEPYLESVPQAFIQTAFFTIANSLTATSTRLCYNELDSPCQVYDNCSDWKKCSKLGFDNNLCDPIGFNPLNFKSFEEIKYCQERTQNCTLEFEQCVQPLNECLERCQANLTTYIASLDQESLYMAYANESLEYINHTLSVQYGASLADFKSIQLYLLFVGNQAVFLATFILSILGSSYGVTKFFRLSQAKILDEGDLCAFALTFMINCIYIVAKGWLLATFLLVWENEMYINVIWWLVFCMLPSFVFSLLVIFGGTFYRTKFKICSKWRVWSNYSLTLVAEEPPIVIVPVVTPFMFRTKMVRQELRNDNGTIKRDKDGKKMFGDDVDVDFKFCDVCSVLNYGLTVVCSAAGLILKAQMPMETVIPISILIILPGYLIRCFKDECT